jgi:actin-like ATPase involved in cell morphogenesis
MGRIVGIDLGTTYSAVAIPEERTGEGFMVVRDCPGYSIILDRWKNRITPSVVAENERGEIVVGHAAKNRAGFSPEPIMFAKRDMGQDKTFQLKRQGVLQPEEVSAHILRYLKQLAEERLGEPVDEAVITVPAYFELRAKQMTEKAGELAGLRVAQIAQEPVAAALMYCAGDPRDSLRVMTYDLGGGTFDIAILEKRDGTISTDSILAFDGDHFLGGYDFDKTVAKWLEDQLNARSYDLHLDLDNSPADRAIHAKLMVYAERAKIALSRSESYEFQEPSTGIVDHAGIPVAIDGLWLTRDKFEAMIRKQVEYTLELCHRAMEEKANPSVHPDQIDEILMVGGSSRIPLIGRRLEEEFGRKPRLVEPDLCVALGAAILAGTKPKTFGRLRLDPIPAETDLPNVTVTGRVVPGDDLKSVEGCEVALRALDGSYQSKRKTGPEGAFVFDAVPLVTGDQTEFALAVTSPAGQQVAAHRFTVVQTERPKGGLVEPVTNVLAKPIGIVFEGGFQVIAPERTPLPHEAVVHAETRDTTGTIRVPIHEGNNPLGEIVMKDIPPSVTIGSEVLITLTIQENYQIVGRALVTALKREEQKVFELSIPSKKSIEELRREYENLAAQADNALAGASPGERFSRARRLRDRQRDVEEMLHDSRPELAAIQDRLNEIESLVREIRVGWKPEPPRAVLEQKVREAEDTLVQIIQQKPNVAQDGYDKRLAAIQAEADNAYATHNTAAWKESFDKVVKLCDELDHLKPPPPPPDPIVLKRSLEYELKDLERQAKAMGRYQELEDEFQEAREGLSRIDPRAPDAMLQIRDWYFTHLEELRKRLGAPEPEADDEAGRLRRVIQKGKN